jgi:hypothetical protein
LLNRFQIEVRSLFEEGNNKNIAIPKQKYKTDVKNSALIFKLKLSN